MKRTSRFLGVSFLLIALVIPPFVQAADDGESGLCSVFGWAVRPIGWCKKPIPVVVVTPDIEVEPEVKKAPPVATQSTSTPTTIIQYSTTTTPIRQEVTNKYITVEQSGITEEVLDGRISELMVYINSLPHLATVIPSQPSDVTKETGGERGVSKDYLLKSLDKVSDQIANSRDSLTDGASLNNSTLVASTLTGDTYVSGRLGIGTASPSEILSVAGAIYLDSVNPANTTNRLYNFGGDLYWNGSVITSSTTSNWAASAGNAFRLSGNVGIGTSTPSDTLTVAGTLSAGTTTARIMDTGGQVCNVEAYGAVGDNSAADLSACRLTRAVPSGIVFFLKSKIL